MLMTNLYLSDIPLGPVIQTDNNETGFHVHWLDNKELHFTVAAEELLSGTSYRNEV